MYLTIERVEYYSQESGKTYSDLDTYFREEVTPKITAKIYDADLNELHFGNKSDISSDYSDADKSDNLFYHVYNNAYFIKNDEEQVAMRELCYEFNCVLPTQKGIYYFDERKSQWCSAKDALDLAEKVEKIRGESSTSSDEGIS